MGFVVGVLAAGIAYHVVNREELYPQGKFLGLVADSPGFGLDDIAKGAAVFAAGFALMKLARGFGLPAAAPAIVK